MEKGWLPTPGFLGFPGGPAGNESTCNAGDLGSEDPLEKGLALKKVNLDVQMLVSVEQQAVWMVSWPSSPLENPCTSVCAKLLRSCPLFVTPWTVAHQAPLGQ